jgi:pyrroloquinoline quinone biosynthesis protein A
MRRKSRHGACVAAGADRDPASRLASGRYFSQNRVEGLSMQWTTPSYSDMRFGFEITMYIATR